MLENLKRQVCEANKRLCSYGLVTLTWGNVSGLERNRGLVVIKPSGVNYDELAPDKMVVIDLDGKKVEGELNPSSDTPTHLYLYKNFLKIGGITHTHSEMATSFAQARRGIECFGTTHADYFYGEIPITRELSNAEIEDNYELNTGKVIVERFHNLDCLAVPGVLVASHGPFTWGGDAEKSVENSLVLEQVAKMAFNTLMLNSQIAGVSQFLLDKHYQRKHGPGAYYGQQSKQ